MTDPVFRALFPNAPLNQRTEGDPARSMQELRKRLRLEARARALQTVTPGLQMPSLVSSYEGTIKALLLAIPTYELRTEKYLAIFRSLLAALPRDTSYTVVHHASTHQEVKALFSGAGATKVTYVALPDYINFMIWAEDAYVALTDLHDGSRFLMEPWTFNRSADAMIADAVEGAGVLTASQAPLIFQGGNCLIGDDFWLLGRDYFVESIDLLYDDRPPVLMPADVTDARAVEILFTEFLDRKRRLVVVGPEKRIALDRYVCLKRGEDFILDHTSRGVGSFQPIFHIDMFISLIGRTASGKFGMLVADPRMTEAVTGASPYALPDVYDFIADQLTGLGFEVKRNPLAVLPADGPRKTLTDLKAEGDKHRDMALLRAVDQLRNLGASDETGVVPRYWHHITWNNCLVENAGPGRRNVYLPTYGEDRPALTVFDNQMADIWEKLGFKVHKLADCNVLAARQGVVHCIKKYLGRGG